MTIIRTIHDKKNPYVMLNKEALWDPNLSLEAAGLWARLMSRPDDWMFRTAELSKSCGVSIDAINKILKELISNGYAYRHQTRMPNGKHGPWEIMVFEKRTAETEIQIILPQPILPDPVPPDPVKHGHTNKDLVLKKEKSSNKAKRPPAPAAASIEEQIRNSRIPSEKHEAAINYYLAFKDEVDKKDNPVGWIVKMFDVGKIDSMQDIAQQSLREASFQEENALLAKKTKDALEARSDVQVSLHKEWIRIDFSGKCRPCGGKFDSPEFKKDLLNGLLRAGFHEQVFQIVEEWQHSKEDSIFNKILDLKYVKSMEKPGECNEQCG